MSNALLSISLPATEWREVAELLSVVAAELTDIYKYPSPMRSDLLTKRMKGYAKRAAVLSAAIKEKL